MPEGGDEVMSDNVEKPKARPVFRKLALWTGVVCCLLGTLFAFTAPKEDRLIVVLVCSFVGIVMVTISETGSWPRPKQ